MSNTNVGVIVGRFQPITLEQIKRLFIPALSENDAVIVILGSSDTARDDLDPFTASQRELMILQALSEIAPEHRDTPIIFRPVRDYWSNRTRFITTIQNAVSTGMKETYGDDHRLSNSSINLYGVDREDEDSAYLNNFPTWNSRVQYGGSVDSFKVMTEAYEGKNSWMGLVATSTYAAITTWLNTEDGKRIKAGNEHIVRYRSKYDPLEESAGHVLQFMTVDNVVLHKGHILLVRRRSHPGKGLWALPGGFLESYETTVDGAKRELREETRLKVKDEWQTGFKHFDHPYRSRRGRTLTFAYKWEIPAWRNVPQLSPDKGFEREVTKVQWFPLSEVINDMSHLLFEDHLDIIESLAY
jgi:bifunctional NMN adenylyltransferase/nudix hydrolase